MDKHFLNRITCMTISHHQASVEELEGAAFKDESQACIDLLEWDEVEEVAVLQTCNRVELYIVSSEQELKDEFFDDIASFMFDASSIEKMDILRGLEALEHLFEVSTGLVSMISGEDEILGQVSDTFERCVDKDFSGDILNLALEKSIHVGKRVRNETNINSGPRSIGSATVKFVEENFASTEEAKFAIIGAGEVANLVGKSLQKRGYESLFIADNDLEKAEKLIEKVGDEAFHSEKSPELFSKADVVVSATSSEDVIFDKQTLKDKITDKTLVVDLANPRDVDEDVEEIDNVSLFDLDDLNCVLERNRKEREKRKEEAEEIIDQELDKLLRKYKEQDADRIAKNIYQRAEKIRKRETKKALRKLETENGELDDREKKVLKEVTRSVAEKILHEPISSLKEASINDDKKVVKIAKSIFDIED